MFRNVSFAHNKLFAFTRTDLLFVVVVAVMGLLGIGFIFPRLKKTKSGPGPPNCVNNLKQVGLAFRLWAGDHNDKYPMQVSTNDGGPLEYMQMGDAFRLFLCMSNELATPTVLVCPADNRLPAKSFASLSNSNISYFVGLDATETMPQMMLTGDRNLAINGVPVTPGLVTLKSNDVISWTAALHNGEGNLGMADGSVQRMSTAGFRQMSRAIGTNLYRLAVP
jgi:prepilin-type processing-associated H-X9-DG protein